MSEETFYLTPEQRRKLLAKLPEILEGDGEEHLTDEDFINYALGPTSEQDEHYSAAHLKLCEACAGQMAAFMAETEVWRGEEGERRLDAFREKLKSAAAAEAALEVKRPITLWGRFGDLARRLSIPNPFMQSLQPQLQFKTVSEFPPYQTEDRLLGISFVEEKNNDLSVYIDSYVLDLEGRVVRVAATSASWEETLRRIDSDQLSAVVTIPRSERKLLVNSSELSVSLVTTNSSTEEDAQGPEV
jgi:hypothetical protein